MGTASKEEESPAVLLAYHGENSACALRRVRARPFLSFDLGFSRFYLFLSFFFVRFSSEPYRSVSHRVSPRLRVLQKKGPGDGAKRIVVVSSVREHDRRKLLSRARLSLHGANIVGVSEPAFWVPRVLVAFSTPHQRITGPHSEYI